MDHLLEPALLRRSTNEMTLNETLDASRKAEEAWRSLGRKLRTAMNCRTTPFTEDLRRDFVEVSRRIQNGFAHSRMTSCTLATQIAKGKFRGEADIHKILHKLPPLVQNHVRSGMMPPMADLSVKIMSLRFRDEKQGAQAFDGFGGDDDYADDEED
jgi:hypothetical protein